MLHLQALARFQNSHKVTTKSGIETEESLLYESAARETSLNSQILDLEADTKHLRLELERVTAERDQLTQQVKLNLAKIYLTFNNINFLN